MRLNSLLLIPFITQILPGSTWIHISSPHFEIHTDAGEVAARRVLTRFEQARRVLDAVGPGPKSAFPTRILLYASARDYASIRPASNVPGFYQSGPERDYIAMLAGAEIDRIVLHEYTHAVLNHALHRLPQWLEEGLAEYYSTLSAAGGKATLGAPVAAHVETLRTSDWLPAATLAAVAKDSPHYNEAGKNTVFYAQSWALTHMLERGAACRGKLPDFIERLSKGEPQAAAFQASFGRSWEEALAGLPAYVRAGFSSITVEAPPAAALLFSPVEALDPVEAAQSRAEILLLEGRDRDAQRIYEDIARRNPRSPSAQTGLAVVAMRDHDVESARAYFEKAIALGASDASTYFEYAMLLRDGGADPDLVTRFLEKAVAANPAHAEAQFLLGVRATDRERYSDALSHLRRAVEILPRQAYFWQALSYANLKLNLREQARDAAARALACAGTAHEREMAEAALKLAQDPPSDARPAERRSGVVTPEAWTPRRGDRAVTGRFLELACRGETASLRLATDSGIVSFDIADPGRVASRGAAGARITLTCGPQDRRPVTVEYDSATNTVRGIEFR